MAKLGIVKNFLKFKHDMQFGVIGCGRSNISYLPNKKGEIGSLCMIGFAEDVIIWNVEIQEIVHRFHGRDHDNVTYLTYMDNQFEELTIAVGYASGYVSVYSLWDFKLLFSLKLHKHPVTKIIYCEPYGDRIVCGSMDTNISVVDMQTQRGYCLQGHVSPITHMQYVHEHKMLISSSQDGNIKLWFLDQNHCFKTISTASDVWDFVYVSSTNLLITGGTDAAVTLWQFSFIDQDAQDFDLDGSVVDRLSNAVQVTSLGLVPRQGSRRVVEMVTDKNRSYVALNTGDKNVEVFKIMSKEEIAKKLKKKAKKALSQNQNAVEVTLTAGDRLRKSCEIVFPKNCKSLSMIYNEKKSTLEMLTSMKNNSIAVMDVNMETYKMEVSNHVATPGHRSAVICVLFTSDGQGILTVSLSEAKMWNKSELKCCKTIDWPCRRMPLGAAGEDTEYIEEQLAVAPGKKLDANTAVLLPGDRHAAVGFKVGVIILFNLVNGDIVQWLDAHTESVTSLVMTADRTRLLSSSTDKSLRMWRLEYGLLNSGAKGKLSLADSGTCQRYSHGISRLAVTPDNKTVLVALLNNKVQSCPLDSLNKRLLDFYHHSQPVTCIDVRHDGSEMLTGAGDKSVVKWSLQFADCRVFKGHRDAVTDVRYVPGRTAEALSADCGGVVVHIDLTTMTEIARLCRHWAGITSLAVRAAAASDDGEGECEVVTASADCSVRLWYESDEILAREVEAEAERERRYEEEELARAEVVVVGVPRVALAASLPVTKRTLGTEHGTDAMMAALDSLREASDEAKEDARRNVRAVLAKVTSGDLEHVLALLPMPYVEELFELATTLLERAVDVELCVRCLDFLGHLHFKTIIANERLRPLFPAIARHSYEGLCAIKRRRGFLLEAFRHLREAMGPVYVEHKEARSKAKPKKKNNK